MKYGISVLLFICLFLNVQSQEMDFFLPDYVSYNQSIPTPKSVLGFEVGEWHVSHDQLVFYMRTLANASDRITLKEYGRTYEGRPLLALMISNPKNLSNLEEIRKNHVNGVKTGDLSASKLVHYMGYSVHGNEASGANASLLAAYFLAAAEGAYVDELLDKTIILLDPSFNPDGLQRFSTWVNMHKSQTLATDPQGREFDEVWPGGRTNHYWFDLNRDWMPVQLPESQGRIKLYHEWKPNVLTDHHEMGSDNTFFFQPGIPSRQNPITPQKNLDLTHQIAAFHAAALDSIGSLYYSEESFDDYYIGKGSSYPDINGSIGILFEQASSRGHARETQYGLLTFSMAIRNHFNASLSTLRASLAMNTELLQFQANFYKESEQLAKNDPVKAIVFGENMDPMRNYELAKLIQTHDIQVYQLAKPVTEGGKRFESGTYVVPMQQPQYRLIKAMFEKRTSFTDSLFYDISTWTLPLAFNVAYAELGTKSFNQSLLGAAFTDAQPQGSVDTSSDYAYIFEPYGYFTQRALMRLFDAGIVTQIAHAEHRNGQKIFARGSVIIPVGIQREKSMIINEVIDQIAKEDGIDVYGIKTGLAVGGVDLGSPQTEVLERPNVAILVGDGVSGYEAGETWHLLDTRFNMAVTLLPVETVSSQVLSKYNRLIIPHGSYRSLASKTESLKEWVSAGGVIIAWKGGSKWLADQQISKIKYKSNGGDNQGYLKYVDLDQTRGAQVIGGSIFEATLDLGHPLTYGFTSDKMPLFRNHTLMMEKGTNQYAYPVRYTAAPLLSGYISSKKLSDLASTPAVAISTIGRGRIVNLADNPNFRAFWYGTNKLFLNALFFGNTISSRAGE